MDADVQKAADQRAEYAGDDRNRRRRHDGMTLPTLCARLFNIKMTGHGHIKEFVEWGQTVIYKCCSDSL